MIVNAKDKDFNIKMFSESADFYSMVAFDENNGKMGYINFKTKYSGIKYIKSWL